MKSLFALVAIILFGASLAQAEPRWQEFLLSAPHGQVIIDWTMEDETGCTSLVIERSTDGVEYFDIATFTPQGAGLPYRYIDTDVFKQSTRVFHYRIRAVMDQRFVHSEIKSIVISISTVQQTWGSLKALFR
ncbi:MAG TPA: hypothetical protein ENH10_10225 [Bacteroidetes bacterium]|nr:hypothetical protein BMS3Bbin04_00991 [bacterium BMS3Bbin04]HDO66382.1 hypothetical protein [Bacteroidota bacterium]HEX05507.1 hypothetical protein [Bacteroidota bacterium]